MSFIRPFSAALIRPSWSSRVLAPPHDSLSQEERDRIMASNEFSYLHVTRRVDGGTDQAPSHGNLVALDRLVAEGAYRRWRPSSFYVYRLSASGHEQTGIVADVSIEAAKAGLIRGHEAVRVERVEALLRHFQEVPARSDLVILLHPADRELTGVLERCRRKRPILSVSGELGTHIVWRLDEPREIAHVQDRLRNQILYVADGHHRLAATQRLQERGRVDGSHGVLSVILPENAVRVLSFHRRVVGPADDEATFHQLTRIAEVKRSGSPPEPAPGSFGAYLAGSWQKLTLRVRRRASGAEALDVSRLHREILEPIFSLAGPNDPRLETIPGTVPLELLERSCDQDRGVAFTVAPPTVAQIRNVADRREVMPPKATWFHPKPPSGLFLQYQDASTRDAKS